MKNWQILITINLPRRASTINILFWLSTTMKTEMYPQTEIYPIQTFTHIGFDISRVNVYTTLRITHVLTNCGVLIPGGVIKDLFWVIIVLIWLMIEWSIVVGLIQIWQVDTYSCRNWWALIGFSNTWLTSTHKAVLILITKIFHLNLPLGSFQKTFISFYRELLTSKALIIICDVNLVTFDRDSCWKK